MISLPEARARSLRGYASILALKKKSFQAVKRDIWPREEEEKERRKEKEKKLNSVCEIYAFTNSAHLRWPLPLLFLTGRQVIYISPSGNKLGNV